MNPRTISIDPVSTKLFFAIFSVLLIVSLPSCSLRPDSVTGESVIEEAAATSSPPITQKVIVGVSLPLTGHAAFGGIRARDGIEMAYKDLPEEERARISLIFDDDKCLGKEGLDAVHSLIENDDADLLLGPICNAALLPNADYLKERAIPEISLGTITDTTAALGEFHFALSTRIRDLMSLLASHAYEKRGARAIAILYLEDDFGQESSRYFEGYFKGLGGKIVAKEHFGPAETDFKTQLAKIKAAEPDGIFLMSYGSMIIAQVRQMDELGFKTQIYAPVPAHDPDLVSALGEKAEGMIYPYPYEATGSDVQASFESRLRERDITTDFYRSIAYDSARALFQAIGSCGQDKACVKSYLSSLKDFDGVGGNISLDDQGIGVRKISINTIRDGKFIPVD
ncbi:MAG: penicillin-binding protein activator [Nanoarchaeota archaeon]